MIRYAPSFEQGVTFAWPVAIVKNHKGLFIGYLMPLLDFRNEIQLEQLLTGRARQQAQLPEDHLFRLKAAIDLVRSVVILHQQEHAIIDLKPVNLMVNRKTAAISVVDCDGFYVHGNNGHFPGHQFTTGYIAPEVYARKLTPDQLDQQQDLFALPVIIFQLLNNGIHPFQGVPKANTTLPTDNQARINAGLYPYGRRQHGKIAPSPWSVHRDFPSALREALEISLTSQKRYTAEQWLKCLQTLQQNIRQCKNNSDHYHWGNTCPHCHQSRQQQQQLRENTRAAKRRTPKPRKIKTKTQQHAYPYQPAHRPAARAPQATNYRLLGMALVIILAIFYVVIAGHEPPAPVNPSNNLDELNKLFEQANHYERSAIHYVELHSKGNVHSTVSKERRLQFDGSEPPATPYYQLTDFNDVQTIPYIKPQHAMLNSSLSALTSSLFLGTTGFGGKDQTLGQFDQNLNGYLLLNDWQYDEATSVAYTYICVLSRMMEVVWVWRSHRARKFFRQVMTIGLHV